MHGWLLTFLADTAAAVVAAAVLATITAVVRMDRTVRGTAASATQLAESVAILQTHDANTRERLAALEGPPWGRAQRYRLNGEL